jgi:SAM-dependent methyltransferase
VQLRKQIIGRKPQLLDVYMSFYKEFLDVSTRVPNGLMVELGSGAGFLKEILPFIMTTDVVDTEFVDKVFSAEYIELEDSSVSAFFLLNVFHHIKNPRKFFDEVERCLKPGGRLVMIEPANTVWGRFIRKHFHHEPHDDKAGWEIGGSGPMSDANLALPWIIFARDLRIFEHEYPNLQLIRYQPHTPFRYLLSGGVSYKSVTPKSLVKFLRFTEKMMNPFNRYLGMFVTIECERSTQMLRN